jgi:hypothetical protein
VCSGAALPLPINIINTEAASDASKETCIEVNAEKTKYMFMSSEDIIITWVPSIALKNVTKFKYLAPNQNCIHKQN